VPEIKLTAAQIDGTPKALSIVTSTPAVLFVFPKPIRSKKLLPVKGVFGFSKVLASAAF